jgi:hypothetical protein
MALSSKYSPLNKYLFLLILWLLIPHELAAGRFILLASHGLYSSTGIHGSSLYCDSQDGRMYGLDRNK